MFKRIREYENLHILLWLLKDTCWVLDFKVAGMMMLVPTLFAAFHITYLARNKASHLFHNLAVCCWISANGIWMTGEFFFNDTLRPYATVFFVLGLGIVFSYYVRYYRVGPETVSKQPEGEDQLK